MTGLLEEHYPTSKRLIKYLLSFLVTLPILVLTVFALIFSLNLRGYVTPNHQSLYYSLFSNLSEKGKTFDKNSNASYATTLIHVFVIYFINTLYSNISQQATKRENHLTVESFENSLIIKRFLFETFTTFTDLSYIAFIQFDIKALKSELISIYMFDEIRRLILETIIPTISKYFMMKKQKKISLLESQKKRDSNSLDQFENYISEKLVEIRLPEYETFDDYLEIVINFGYITLFASAFPMAPVIIYIFHWVEMRSDKYKIIHAYRRPYPSKSRGIGSWNIVLNTMSFLCVISNIILFAFSSDQIAGFFPSLFKHIGTKTDSVDSVAETGSGRYLVAIIFIIEHFAFIIVFILRKIVKSLPCWTDIYLKREEYKKIVKKDEGY